jgi:hypothetical protein
VQARNKSLHTHLFTSAFIYSWYHKCFTSKCFISDLQKWKFLGSRSGLYGDRQCVPSSLQEAVANIVLGCTFYFPSSIPVPQGISERKKTPQIDVVRAKMC